MNRTIKVGELTVVCRNIPDNWTEEEIRHYAWMQIVNMHIKKAEKEVIAEKIKYAG